MRTAVLLIRYRTTTPTSKSKKYVSYKRIASTLNLTENEVQHICRKALMPTRKLSADMKVRMLDQAHYDFLLNPRILERWAGLTMKQRTIMFHRQFTDKRIAVTSLRRLYLRNGIRCKKVRQEKVMPERTRQNFVQKCRSLIEDIEQAK